jgi:hypothetical protein
MVSSVFETALRALNVTAAGAAIVTEGIVVYPEPAVLTLTDVIRPVVAVALDVALPETVTAAFAA